MLPSDATLYGTKKLALPPYTRTTNLTDAQIEEGLARLTLRLPVIEPLLWDDERFLRKAWGYILDGTLNDPTYPNKWTDADVNEARRLLLIYIEMGQRPSSRFLAFHGVKTGRTGAGYETGTGYGPLPVGRSDQRELRAEVGQALPAWPAMRSVR